MATSLLRSVCSSSVPSTLTDGLELYKRRDGKCVHLVFIEVNHSRYPGYSHDMTHKHAKPQASSASTTRQLTLRVQVSNDQRSSMCSLKVCSSIHAQTACKSDCHVQDLRAIDDCMLYATQ